MSEDTLGDWKDPDGEIVDSGLSYILLTQVGGATPISIAAPVCSRLAKFEQWTVYRFPINQDAISLARHYQVISVDHERQMVLLQLLSPYRLGDAPSGWFMTA